MKKIQLLWKRKSFKIVSILSLIMLISAGWILICWKLDNHYQEGSAFSYEIINNAEKELEEVIIGEYTTSDSTGEVDRVQLAKLQPHTVTRGAVDISNSNQKVGNFYIHYIANGTRRILKPTLMYDYGKKGLRIRIIITDIDPEGYISGETKINTFVFSEQQLDPDLQRKWERESQ